MLPLGISFYTFQSLGYLIDVKRGKYPPEKNFLKYALFAAFFPQMIQGPISRYDMLSETLYGGADFDFDRLGRGLVRILWGAAKKLLVADRLAPGLALLFGAEADSFRGGWVLLGMVLYALRLYADFTGGIDMALGVGELFGVILPENFDRPYLSKNIEEYWTRWHMTMGSWFRDYVFYPLNVSKTFLKWTKALRTKFGDGFLSRLPLYTATLVTWLLTGVWHGAGWNFALWGLTNGVVIILSLTLKPLYDRFHSRFPGLKERKVYGVFEVLRTFLLMCLIRLWDCYAGPGGVWGAFSSLFTTFNGGAVLSGLSALGLSAGDWLVLLVMAALMLLVVSLKKGTAPSAPNISNTPGSSGSPPRPCSFLTLLLAPTAPATRPRTSSTDNSEKTKKIARSPVLFCVWGSVHLAAGAGGGLGELGGVVGDVVLVEVVLQGRLHRLLRQDRAVELVGGEPVQGLHHGLVGQLHHLFDGLALDHLRGHGAGGDGAAAAEGGELGVGDDAVVDLQKDLHDVAALGVAHLAHAVRVLDDAHVPGVQKMIHHFFAV